MKNSIALLALVFISLQSFGQMVMTAEGIDPENICKQNTVYFLMSDKAKPIEPIDSIEIRINQAIKFVKENPSFESKPSVQLAINCKGEIGGGFHNVTKSGNDGLDKELIEFFKSVTGWKSGKIKRKTVDSWYMWRMEIKNGYIDILN
jgi:hypothetical protein